MKNIQSLFMFTNNPKIKVAILALAVAGLATSCKENNNDDPTPKANLRPSIDYSKATKTTPYNVKDTILFVDAKGDSTVDRTEGRWLLAMFRELDAYARTGTTTQLDVNVLKNRFSNTSSPFTDAKLNTSSLQIRTHTGSSLSNPEAVRSKIEEFFANHVEASKSFADSAKSGKAGIAYNGTSKYLVDAKGIEWAQIISKSLMGALQLDYIGNTLLANLDVDNTTVLTGKNYTQLEHNWDIAYGLFTNSDRYAAYATDAARDPKETLIGSYVWEYNKAAYPKMHEAFLKGRIAIVNNDKATLKAQADYIRKEIEKAIAGAALGYLGKWKTGTTVGSRAHAIGEGGGFIYSLRFAKMYGADVKFSDDIINPLLFTGNGFWDLTTDKIVVAENAIKSKFGL